MRLAPYLQATASGRPYTRGPVKKNGQPSSPMAKLGQRNAHVFPGNSGASSLGNRAGEGELAGDRLHNQARERRVTKRVTVQVEY